MVADWPAKYKRADSFDNLSDWLIDGERFEHQVHPLGWHEDSACKGQRENNDKTKPLHCFNTFGKHADDGSQPRKRKCEQ